MKHSVEEIDAAVLAELAQTSGTVSEDRLVNQPLAAQALSNAALAKRFTLSKLGVEAFGSVRLTVDRLDLVRTEEFLSAQRRSDSARLSVLSELQELFAGDGSAKLWRATNFPNTHGAINDGTIDNIVNAVRSESEQRALDAELPHLMDAFLRMLKFASNNDLAVRVEALGRTQDTELPERATKSIEPHGELHALRSQHFGKVGICAGYLDESTVKRSANL